MRHFGAYAVPEKVLFGGLKSFDIQPVVIGEADVDLSRPFIAGDDVDDLAPPHRIRCRNASFPEERVLVKETLRLRQQEGVETVAFLEHQFSSNERFRRLDVEKIGGSEGPSEQARLVLGRGVDRLVVDRYTLDDAF